MDDLTRIQTVDRTPLALRSDQTGDLYKLAGEMLVGREVECDIQLAVPQVSRYHAKLFVSPNGVFVEDLRSSNGTFVNGRKVRARTALGLGDQLAFDDMTFRVTTARSGNTDHTQVATSQNLPKESVEEINRIAADKLKPADIPPPSKKEWQRPPTEALAPGRSAPSRSGGIQPAPEPKVHDITDMEAFLRFAGSGLKPQEPAPSSPFGLSNKRASQSASSDAQEKVEDVSPQQKHAVPDGLPLESDSSAMFDASKQADAVPPPSPPQSSPSSPEVSIPPREDSTPPQEDENTRYVSLNTMDRYVSNNARYNHMLNVGEGPRLIAMTAPIRGKVFSLRTDEDVKCWSIGRDDSADICLRDKGVSREHAWITKLDALYELRVNESAGDILVNGETVNEIALKHGDRMQFGTMEIIFRLDSPAAETPVPVEAPRKGLFARIIDKIFQR